MKPGFYVVEPIGGGDRTIIRVAEHRVEWVGGDETSTVEAMLKDFRVIRELNIDGAN